MSSNIDSSKLSRDYVKNPLKKIRQGSILRWEEPEVEDIVELYINQNKNCSEISKFLGIGLSCFLRFKRKHKIVKSNGQQYQKRKEKMIEHYGFENNFQSEESKKKCCDKSVYDKRTKTILEKYGSKYYFQSDDFRKKHDETKRKNHSFNSSKPEKEIERLLKTKYPQTKTQYKSESYPFNCDFYIPEIDTYIEYQGTWFHGGEPYVGSKKQKSKEKLWESKEKNGHKSYSRAIRIWTIEDKIKRDTANKNGLKYLEFFNMNQFMNWFKKI